MTLHCVERMLQGPSSAAPSWSLLCSQWWRAAPAPLHAGMVGRHSPTTLPVATAAAQSASLLDMWHFWLLQSIKCWKGKLPRATPSLKCFTAASPKVRWCISPERRLQSPSVQQLISDSATTQFCVSPGCANADAQRNAHPDTAASTCLLAGRRMELRMVQSHGTNCGDLSSRDRVVPRDQGDGL